MANNRKPKRSVRLEHGHNNQEVYRNDNYFEELNQSDKRVNPPRHQCQKGYVMGPDAICIQTGGELYSSGNNQIQPPNLRESCMDNCDDLQDLMFQCYSATSNPGIAGCHCQALYFGTPNWGGMNFPTVMCSYSGESYAQCMYGCWGRGGHGGSRAGATGRSGGVGRRHASGGRIRRRRR